MAAKKSAPVPAAPAAKPYFTSEALKFLANLARHNDRAWFQPRKAEYEALLREPMLAVIRKVTEAMLDFAPEHVRPAEKSLFRIYRDTRFSPDKSPYKTHVAAWWVHHGLEKTSGAGYYVEINAKSVLVAAGAYMPQKEQLAQIRHWLLDHHTEFRKILNRPALRKQFSEFEGNPLVRAPKGFAPDHPAMDLVRCRQWGFHTYFEPEFALAPDFAARLTRLFKLAAPLVAALNTPLAAAIQSRKRVFFGLR
jgi:uncharacterized protein (TIGR02453 family)